MYEMSCQSRFDARYWMLGAGALGKKQEENNRMGKIRDLFTQKAVAPYSSTLAWKIPWMEEPGRLKSMRSLRVGHD